MRVLLSLGMFICKARQASSSGVPPVYAYCLRRNYKNRGRDFVEVLAEIVLVKNKGGKRYIPWRST
jgi:hypothetical protein